MFNLNVGQQGYSLSRQLLIALPFAMLFLFSCVYMVSGSGLIFSFMEHRLSYEDSYTISVDLTPLVALLAATCFIILARSKILLSILPLSGFLLYPYLGFNLALGTSSIFLVILGCYKMKLWSEFFSILLASLSVVYLLSIVY